VYMRTAIVGYSGFVGSNICAKFSFDFKYDIKNITEAFGTKPDLLVYAAVSAEKYMANENPSRDIDLIKNAFDTIVNIAARKLVLISSIDVCGYPVFGDEDECLKTPAESAYGTNRRILEEMVRERFPNCLIVRLPALFGMNLRKNFIFDILNRNPTSLSKAKYQEIFKRENQIADFYSLEANGFYKLHLINEIDSIRLNHIYSRVGFSSLNFTDSRNKYQFYDLQNLWKHIEIAVKNEIEVLNVATEPISAEEIYCYLSGAPFCNIIRKDPLMYDFRTKYAVLFGGDNGYIFTKKKVLEDISKFIKRMAYKLSISNIAWQKESDDKVCSYAKSKGYSGIEVAPNIIAGAEPYDHLLLGKEYAQELYQKHGLRISSMQSICYGKKENIFGTAEENEELRRYVCKAIDFARLIECKNIVFGCPKNRIITSEVTQHSVGIDFFKFVGNYAAGKDVVVSIEPNPKIYGTNFLNTTSEAIKFIEEVNSPGIMLNLDLGTMIENGENLDTIEKHILKIHHIHVSEPNLARIEKRSLYSDLAKMLLKHGYKGYVSIEMNNKNTVQEIFDAIDYINEVF